MILWQQNNITGSFSTDYTAILVFQQAPIINNSDSNSRSFLTALSLYLVVSFLECQKCGKCCRPNDHKWDRGIILTRDEAIQIRPYCKIDKRNGQQYIKYPCQLQRNNRCVQYLMRPLSCRLFPFNILYDGPDNLGTFTIIMACPAAKEFYITINLFMQDFYLYIDNCRKNGKNNIDFSDLEVLKNNFTDKMVDEKELKYIKNQSLQY